VQISAENLSIGYSTPLAQGITFEISPGTALGLVGPNGSGKTTLIRTLLALNEPLAGNIEVNPTLETLRAKGQIGVVWQDAGLPFSVSAARWIKQLGRLSGMGQNDDLLALLQVPTTKRPIRSLSGGEKQRLALYSALAHHPQLLILDEPTVGLDEETRSVFYTLMRDFLAKGGAALITSHYAMDIAAICNQVLSIGNKSERRGTAFFTTSKPLEDLTIAKFNLAKISNGYEIQEPIPWSVLIALQSEIGCEILSYQVISNA
jgi:ABC-2 type transport system ATP-binding protein